MIPAILCLQGNQIGDVRCKEVCCLPYHALPAHFVHEVEVGASVVRSGVDGRWSVLFVKATAVKACLKCWIFGRTGAGCGKIWKNGGLSGQFVTNRMGLTHCMFCIADYIKHAMRPSGVGGNEKIKNYNIVSMIKLHSLLCSIAIISCSNQTTNESSSVKTEVVNSLATEQKIHAFSSDSLVISKSDLTKIYAQSIADYINTVREDYAIKFDTLFFGKHVYGQPDDFPDIELPETIANTQIRLVTPEFGAQKQKDDKSSFFINLMGRVNHKRADFTFVTFSNNNEHQFDYYLDYNYDTKSREFKLDKIRFDNFLYKRK